MKEETGLYTIDMVDTILDLLTRISRKTDELQPLTLKGEKKFHQEIIFKLALEKFIS